ncbi:unnamed protein product [Schistosoma mattheei]|uniref:SEA domain-containing protein n=1 Tax=Schistosoma mattheei TaxID=31246 RepID=A0AA85BYM4_9TREM|nr:unnamed protein product [Schistosoma mattheei]
MLSKVNVPITESQVFGGVTAALSVSFLYPNAQKLNIDSIMDHLKSNYVRNSEISSLKIIQLKVNVTAENVEQTVSSQQPTTELRAVNTDGSLSSQNVLPEDGVTAENVEQTVSSQQPTTELRAVNTDGSLSSQNVLPEDGVTAENVEQTVSSQQPTTELRAVNTDGSLSSQNVLPEDGVTAENVEQTVSSQQPTTELRAVNTDGSLSSQNVLPEDGVSSHQNIVHSNDILVAHYECQTSLDQSSNCESSSDTDLILLTFLIGFILFATFGLVIFWLLCVRSNTSRSTSK